MTSTPSPRVVLVTGAAGHLGRAVAQAFEAAGDRVVLIDRRIEALQAAFGAETETRRFASADLLQAADVQRIVDETLARDGGLDVLCNIAGGFRMGEPVHATGDETWDALFGLNVKTMLHASRAAVRAMLQGGGGKVVNVGAWSAQRGVAQMGAYTASKSVVIRLTEAMAAELRTQGINVNCVLPTIIDTPDNRQAMPEADPSTWVAPADLAAVIVFLASPAARAIHGAALPVTGLA